MGIGETAVHVYLKTLTHGLDVFDSTGNNILFQVSDLGVTSNSITYFFFLKKKQCLC